MRSCALSQGCDRRGAAWLQRHPGGTPDGCVLQRWGLVLVAAAAQHFHVHDVVRDEGLSGDIYCLKLFGSEGATIFWGFFFVVPQPYSIERSGFHQQPLGPASLHSALQHPGVSPHGGHWPLQSLLSTSAHPAPLGAAQPHLVRHRRPQGQHSPPDERLSAPFNSCRKENTKKKRAYAQEN